MKLTIRIFLCLGLAVFSISHAVSKPKPAAAHTAKTPSKKPSGKKADAKTLLGNSRKSLALMIKAARADKGLDAKTPKNKPFWKSTQAIAKNLKTAEKGLTAKSDDFFKGIAQARRAEEQLKIDWQLTDSKNKAVIANAKKMGHSLALLRTQYSKEAARKKKGGALTKEEKAGLGKIKEQQKELLGKLAGLEKKAKKDKALEKGLRKIKAQANHILKQPDTLDAYLATLYLLDEQFGLIRGYEYYVDKPWRADYLWLVKLEPAYDTVYYTWDNSYSYDWVAVDTAVDVYQGEDVDVPETVSDSDVADEESFAEEPVDMSEAEQDEVADDEDTDPEVDADSTPDEDSMEDASDDEGEDMSDDGGGDEGSGDMSDDGGGDEGSGDMSDDGGGDDGSEDMSDDGGGDDGGGDDGGGDDGGGDDGGE